MKLSELRIIHDALSAFPASAPANMIVNREIAALEGKADHAKVMFAHYCGHYGLKPEHLGATFKFRGIAYQITGLNPNAPKFAVNAVRLHDKKGFRFPARDVLTLLPRAAA